MQPSPEEGELADRWTFDGHWADTDASQAALLDHLAQALGHLYDPVELGKSPFIPWLQLEHQARPAVALRRRLVEAIEALRPSAEVPVDSNAWRYYQLLSQRYVGRFAQANVALNLNISPRQLRRLHPLALEALADLLHSQYGLQIGATSPEADPSTTTDAKSLSRKEELARLRRDAPNEATDLCDLLLSALETLAPLTRETAVRIECDLPENLPKLAVQPIATRHALLNLLSVAIRRVNEGTIRISLEQKADQLSVRIEPVPTGRAKPVSLSDQDRENIKAARELIALSGGVVKISSPGDRGSICAILSLPVEQCIPVLVIDDNADALQLFERYLAGSRYRFMGTAEPGVALQFAEGLLPQVIVLDLMLPTKDGWELLGQFRTHPRLRQVPVIVCTVLPQEDLALALGAAGFMRKPISRAAFLAALDAQIAAQALQST
ncbi:MAG: response regulator [Anaerolineae bacterium]|nr:response regulator [Anaerolineae bacterium]